MKTKKLFFIAAAMTLAACSNDTDERPTDADGMPIAANFSVGIGEAVPTRAAGTEWASGDKIGISAANNETMAAKYKNVLFTTNADGTEGKLSSTTTIYFQDMNSVTFNAYYPFAGTEGTLAGTIDGETTAGYQTSGTKQQTIDYLFASATTSYADPSVSLEFSHKMSQIVIEFDDGDGVTTDELDKITEYTISGLRLKGTFDTATGIAKADETKDAADLTIKKGDEDGATLQTSLIVYPQSTTSFTLSLSMDGSTYACDLSVTGGKFEEGKSYTYTITVKKNAISLSTATIGDWTSADGGSGTAAMTTALKDLEDAAVGDYYTSDGKLYGSDITATELNQIKSNIIGVVFALANENDASDYSATGIGTEKCHGYVVALNDANEENVFYSWVKDVYSTSATSLDDITISDGDIIISGGDITISDKYITELGTTGVDKEDYEDIKSWSGYKNTEAIKAAAGGTLTADNYPAAWLAVNYGTAPSASSGWFLPSAAQLKEAFTADGVSDNLTAAGGIGAIDWYWSSTEESYSPIRYVIGFQNGNVYRDYKECGHSVRPVLAF